MGIIVIIAIIYFIGYYLSLKAYPFAKCKACGGRGRFEGKGMYSYAIGRCGKCGGTGRKERLGVRMFIGKK
jgi:DnaJ-class molecular chaperone